MAAQPSQPPPPVSNAHQLAQDALIASIVAPLIAHAFSFLDPADLKGSLPKVKALTAAVVHGYGTASAALAVRYYALERKHAGVASTFAAKPAPPVGADRVDPSIDWAVRGLWGPMNTETITHRGRELQPIADRLETAQTKAAGVAENLVLEPGRDTIIQAVGLDGAAKGWARVPESGCCFFCAMLATRGAVYKTEKTATFETHDHCRCHVEAVFHAYEPSAQIREWQALYAEHGPGRGGMKAAQLRFRRAFEGRTDPAEQRQPALV
jgi:hypothetical protein